MNVSLTPELEEFVSSKVDSGRYTSASEVIREALRLLEEHDQVRSTQLAAFNHELAQRLTALDLGKHLNPKLVRERLQQKSRDRSKRIA